MLNHPSHMKNILLVVLLSISLFATAQQKKLPAIIPQPVSISLQTGEFVLAEPIIINTGKNESLKKIAGQLAAVLREATGKTVRVEEGNNPNAGAINFILTSDASIPAEGYRLTVRPDGIDLSASAAAGIFYGVQTLYQLLPPEIGSKQKNNGLAWTIQGVEILGHPRFGWRGLMLDVSRHFFTVDQVKDYIDQMFKYKFNLLHLHLTDDQG